MQLACHGPHSVQADALHRIRTRRHEGRARLTTQCQQMYAQRPLWRITCILQRCLVITGMLLTDITRTLHHCGDSDSEQNPCSCFCSTPLTVGSAPWNTSADHNAEEALPSSSCALYIKQSPLVSTPGHTIKLGQSSASALAAPFLQAHDLSVPQASSERRADALLLFLLRFLPRQNRTQARFLFLHLLGALCILLRPPALQATAQPCCCPNQTCYTSCTCTPLQWRQDTGIDPCTCLTICLNFDQTSLFLSKALLASLVDALPS